METSTGEQSGSPSPDGKAAKNGNDGAAVSEAWRLELVGQYKEKVAFYQAEANRAHKARDFEGAALCRHMVGEASRFLDILHGR